MKLRNKIGTKNILINRYW